MERQKETGRKKAIAVFLAALAIFLYVSDIVWGVSVNAFSKLNIMLQIIYLIPSIMWFMYVLTLHKKEKSKIIAQIVFGFFMLSAVINCITGLLNIKTILETSASTLHMLTSMFMFIIYPILQIPLFALTIYLVSNKINSAYKPLIGIIIAFIAMFIMNIATNYRFMDMETVRFTLFNGVACTLTFYLSAIIFFMCNKSSQPLKGPEVTMHFNPQQSLADLQSQFESGAITQEEYNERRIEIINNL